MATGIRSAPDVPVDPHILSIRGGRVILDVDLARMYGATTSRLNQQVRRNLERFPADFAFTLTAGEREQVIANCDHLHNLKFRSTLPTAFTEHGALMAATVLNTPEAIAMSVLVIRAFVRLRERLSADREIAAKVTELERRVSEHDESLRALVATLRELLDPPPGGERPRIGFRPE